MAQAQVTGLQEALRRVSLPAFLPACLLAVGDGECIAALKSKAPSLVSCADLRYSGMFCPAENGGG
jgi:hypothetical protein